MTRKHWLDLGPSLLVAAGILLSTLLAGLAARSGWLVLAGPLLLALAVVSADLLSARLRGKSARPSPAALLLAGSFLLACAIVALRDPGLVKTLPPILGGAAWVALLRRDGGRRRTCRAVRTNP
jgi:hypothetical protein